MLSKLLKYDLKSIIKFLSIFYVLAIFFALLTRIFLGIENSFIMNIVGRVCSGATIAMIANILINNLMRLWVRFKSNFYGDESYLTHTLPVKKSTLYLSKVLTAIISTIISFLVIFITLLIAYYSKENFESLKNMFLPLVEFLNNSYIITIILFVFIFLIEFINVLQTGYLGIIIGHRFNNNKVGYSVIFGFVAYSIMKYVPVMILFIVALFNKGFMNLFTTTDTIDAGIVKMIVYIGCIYYLLAFTIEYILSHKLFCKGVNVD